MRVTRIVLGIGLVGLVGAAHAQPRVALVAAAGSGATAFQFLDAQAKLMGTGFFGSVDIIAVNTGQPVPTLAQLQQYDAIMTWSNTTYNDAAALGTLFADYVDAGGGVVATVFANSTQTVGRFLTGRWQAEGYEIIPAALGTTTGSATLGNILMPGHPILDGVNSFNGGTSGFRPTTTTLTTHGQKVAEWSDGKTLVAVSSTFPNRADLGMYPPSSDASAGWWASTTDGARLMANALLYTMADECYPDCTGDGNLTIADFGCFQAAFAGGNMYADCNASGTLTIADFGCFQSAFATGCP